eukprot:850679-Rhodomonas_salina.1
MNLADVSGGDSNESKRTGLADSDTLSPGTGIRVPGYFPNLHPCRHSYLGPASVPTFLPGYPGTP